MWVRRPSPQSDCYDNNIILQSYNLIMMYKLQYAKSAIRNHNNGHSLTRQDILYKKKIHHNI